MALFSNHYYHKSVENFILAFGAFFSDMKVQRYDTNGKRIQELKVPIEYGPRNKWLERITTQSDPANDPKVKMILPRLAYEITDYRYDSERRVGYKGYYTKGLLPSGDYVKVFNPVPYTLSVKLTSICKDNQTSLQILEQILPYFSPSITLSMVMLPQFNLKKDIPITLNNVSIEDTYEGSREEQRVVTQTFDFTAKLDLFGPVDTKSGLIKNTLASVGNFDPNYSNLMNDQIVDPFTANQEDDHVINEEWYDLPKE